jgi:tRNA A37 threonylcarbamoyladenosine dehydratase
METQFSRLTPIIGKKGLNMLKTKTVMVVGIGGVGSACAEALARGGVGKLILIDDDVIKVSNINRQIFALHSTIGIKKVYAAEKRLKDIRPDMCIDILPIFVSSETIEIIRQKKCDLIIDAIDDTDAKVILTKLAQEENIPMYACMGTGNKTDPSMFCFSDIYSTNTCPLCRTMRQKYRKAGIEHLTVLYSPEERKGTLAIDDDNKKVPGSTSYIPPIAGLMLAGRALLQLSNFDSAAS